jgi:hypothetical protein
MAWRAGPPSNAARKVAVLEHRTGDWDCLRCGNHNFAWRHDACNKCKQPPEKPENTVKVEQPTTELTALKLKMEECEKKYAIDRVAWLEEKELLLQHSKGSTRATSGGGCAPCAPPCI